VAEGDLQARALAAVRQAIAEAELTAEEPEPGHVVVSLPGERKLTTTCSLVVGEHSLTVNAFVVRHADENQETFYRWLLEQNVRARPVAFAVDRFGDVYLVGRLPLVGVTPAEVDLLLGTVLELADGSFNTLLELGFASSIRAEWRWRLLRGESTRNLAAFTHLRDDTPTGHPPGTPPAGSPGSPG
jgi:hypothetical protein